MEPMMTLKQASEHLQYSERTLYRIISQDSTFPAKKIRGEWRISPEGLREWIARLPGQSIRTEGKINRPRRGRPPLSRTSSS